MGIRGIPASYSGFETFVEGFATRLVARGYDVTVYNRSTYITFNEPFYKGVKLISLPTIPTKHLDTITHTFLSVLHGMFKEYDVVYICGVGNSLPSALLRLSSKRVVLNVDGADWKRKKWGRFARWFLKTSERLATVLADVIIADSISVKHYYKEHYGRDSVFIPYGTELDQRKPEDINTLQKYQLTSDNYILFVGRLVPENNVHHLIKAYKMIKTDKKLVIIGDAPYADTYKSYLKKLAESDNNIIFTGYVFGEDYKCIMRNTYMFVLASEVGGTHPVLIEALAAGNAVIVNNIPSSIEVIADAGISYDGNMAEHALADKIRLLLEDKELHASLRQKSKKRITAMYLWDKVIDDYIKLFDSLTSENK